MTSAPPLLERAGKAAAILSVAAIVVLVLWLHPDQTWPLRLGAIAALVVAWFASANGGTVVQTASLLAAPLAPALLRAITGREGPVLDVIWMTALSASLIRASRWTSWAMPPAWRLLAGTWALGLALTWPIVAAREVQFDAAGFWELGRVNAEGGLNAAQAVMWTLFVAWTQLLGLLWIDRCCERPRDGDATPAPAHALWIGATLASCAGLYQGLADMYAMNTPFWADQGRATGTLLDANAFGVVAALGAPLAFRAVAAGRWRGATPLAVGLLLVNVAGAWFSGSRTAALTLVVGLAALAGSLSRRETVPGRIRPFAIAGLAAAVLLAGIVVGGNATGPLRRLLELPDAPGEALSAVLNRGPYGTIAALMIVEHPWVGVGPGGYNVIAPDYYRRLWGSGLPFDNAQNWWRQVVAEGGVLGAIAPILLSALIAWCVLREPSAPGRRRTATFVRGLLVALGLASIIQMPTQAPILMLWLATLAGWLPALLAERPSGAWSRPWPSALGLAGLALALAGAAGQAVLATDELAPSARARRTGRPYVTGAYQAEPHPDSNSFNWTSGTARYEWPVESPWLLLRFWLPHPDIETQPVRVTITSPCGPIFDGPIDHHDETSLGLRLPRSMRSIQAEIRVSRTWQPSADQVSDDTRRIGAGVVADFATEETGLTPQRWVDFTSCQAGSQAR